MPKRSPQEFKDQAAARGITFWPVHRCAMCRYQCGYAISGETVDYDAGCACSWGGPQLRSWKDLADQYNINLTNPVIQEYDEFWGFDEKKGAT